MIASCTPWIVVSRSATICEIDTFMTLLSSTITNCAAAKTVIGSQARADRLHFPIVEFRGRAAMARPGSRDAGTRLTNR